MPAAVVWPGVVQPGRVIDTFVSTADIFPTVLAAAHIDLGAEHTIDGKDMGPILRGAPSSNRQHTLCLWTHVRAVRSQGRRA
jgi:arylsulfatase A-like enzyme